MRFQDKIAIVTGGGSGMGKEVATRFVAEGGSVVVNGRPLAFGSREAGLRHRARHMDHGSGMNPGRAVAQQLRDAGSEAGAGTGPRSRPGLD